MKSVTIHCTSLIQPIQVVVGTRIFAAPRSNPCTGCAICTTPAEQALGELAEFFLVVSRNRQKCPGKLPTHSAQNVES